MTKSAIFAIIFLIMALLLGLRYIIIDTRFPSTREAAARPHVYDLSPDESNRNGGLTSSNAEYSTTNLLELAPQKLVQLTPGRFNQVVLAAEHSNDLVAAVDLAEYYDLVVYDLDKQIKYLEIAARQGNGVSQYKLGELYLHNKQVKNYTKANYWLKKAAQSGDKRANALLHDLAW